MKHTARINIPGLLRLLMKLHKTATNFVVNLQSEKPHVQIANREALEFRDEGWGHSVLFLVLDFLLQCLQQATILACYYTCKFRLWEQNTEVNRSGLKSTHERRLLKNNRAECDRSNCKIEQANHVHKLLATERTAARAQLAKRRATDIFTCERRLQEH